MPAKHRASNTIWTMENSLRSCREHHAAATHHEVQITTKRKTIPKKAREDGDAAVEHGKKGHEESHK
jgi:hypothetical protein